MCVCFAHLILMKNRFFGFLLLSLVYILVGGFAEKIFILLPRPKDSKARILSLAWYFYLVFIKFLIYSVQMGKRIYAYNYPTKLNLNIHTPIHTCARNTNNKPFKYHRGEYLFIQKVRRLF